MTKIIFYEKPGCINNTRQKKRLRQAGHTVIEKNLLTEHWSENPQRLSEFFAGKPVSEWFNRSAPDIKQGIIIPETMDEEQAISAMLANPILIRRPLMQVGKEKQAGFSEQEIEQWLGLAMMQSKENLESCPKNQQPGGNHD